MRYSYLSKHPKRQIYFQRNAVGFMGTIDVTTPSIPRDYVAYAVGGVVHCCGRLGGYG